jgi:hypothetical protein
MAKQTEKAFSSHLNGIQYKAPQGAYGMKAYASKLFERAVLRALEALIRLYKAS